MSHEASEHGNRTEQSTEPEVPEINQEIIDAYTIEQTDPVKAEALSKNLSQDTIAKSYLEHAPLYNKYSEAAQEAMETYFALEKSNGAGHPTVVEAKAEWDKAAEQRDSEGAIMKSMFDMLDIDTLRKYQEEMRLQGAIREDVKF